MSTEQFRSLVALYRSRQIEFNNLKPVTLAMWILESGRGTSGLATNHLNFAGMKYRSEISQFAKRVLYNAHDGSGYYCEFATLDDFISGFWAFLDRSPYEGWRDLGNDEIAFIRHIGGVWAEDPNYVSKVIQLLPEAREMLESEVIDVPDPVDVSEEEIEEAAGGHLMPGRPTIAISADGKVAMGGNGLEIDYRGVDSCPYGNSATNHKRRFAGLIIHHTSPQHTTEWYVQYQIDGDPGRGGHHFGYHFYISPAGLIYQGAPLTKRTNQISPSNSVRRAFGSHMQNTNSIGITCARAGTSTGFRPTDEQVTKVKQMVFALCDALDIPFSQVYGHGEIQSNRMRSEGAFLAEEIRAWA
ncbi:MAG: N-acetylmuramoyl-L-alanine amidase [Rhodobacter sp.]|nr:N-acetylmuramoyl-L-alanine amidase [Rhodobacter sp.]